MTNSLRASGGTAPWRRLREYWAAELPYPCWRCGVPIQPGEPWDLGHVIDRANGGQDEHARPEHRHRTGVCIGNRSAGAALSASYTKQAVASASREW